MANGRKIGLIGGLAHRAGVYYYDELVRRYDALGRPAEIMLNHADLTRVLPAIGSGDVIGLGNYLASLANELFDGGADFVAIAAVAPHLAIDVITKAARGPVVSVLDAVTDGLAAAGLERVAIFGNRATMQSAIFGSVAKEKIVALDEGEIELIHATYTDIAVQGKRGTLTESQILSATAHNLIKRGGVQAIMLAGTDLSSFYADTKPDFPHLDVARLHIDAIMARVTHS